MYRWWEEMERKWTGGRQEVDRRWTKMNRSWRVRGLEAKTGDGQAVDRIWI